jgi:hydroxypyruvate reductase
VLAAIEAVFRDAGRWPEGLVIASVGTDGEDGPTSAAGACADASVARAIANSSLDIGRALARCDAYPLLDSAGGLIRTGPTGTNVADLRLILTQ